ncbi:protein involved in protein folding in the ER [Schizosaccharomyces cryophilus OY26]|uniref:Protein involved in protein folding in the ER n=1 Tax=Schizosaccharomyces cryophilus (strain OY26 / ATCC MYA-4695 / CBS 11777 / NBRC 106824 / NRRL Y48691) TaxID=653667 RepID=S9XCI9_SCHCR|nr:protein involved in protein folding in the ER [Schizosaccharomyces cryophilus OY26]EPY51571.1 protein involved in protein folding in the ER [Schizosaccharomyces cryophilus OY26]
MSSRTKFITVFLLLASLLGHTAKSAHRFISTSDACESLPIAIKVECLTITLAFCLLTIFFAAPLRCIVLCKWTTKTVDNSYLSYRINFLRIKELRDTYVPHGIKSS